MPKSRNKLTDKQQAFCQEYIKDWNATQAALRAGYCANSVKVIGCQNLTKVNVIQEIARLQVIERRKHVADRQERQLFWTETMKTARLMADKLRASELLGKSECDFIEKSINLNMDIPSDPVQYKLWLENELKKLKDSVKVIDSYAKSRPAIAERY